jgi:hypothetical protein
MSFRLTRWQIRRISITIGKSGDATFEAAGVQTVSGTTTGAIQAALAVFG